MDGLPQAHETLVEVGVAQCVRIVQVRHRRFAPQAEQGDLDIAADDQAMLKCLRMAHFHDEEKIAGLHVEIKNVSRTMVAQIFAAARCGA